MNELQTLSIRVRPNFDLLLFEQSRDMTFGNRAKVY